MGRRLEPQDVRLARVKELYLSGHEIEEISRIMGYKRTETVRVYLKKMGVYEDYGGIDVPKVLALRNAGWHMDEIIYELGMKYTAAQIIEAVRKYDRRMKRRKA